MSMLRKTQWRNYEDLAREVVQGFAAQLGISHVEAKQVISGASGTQWEIDAKGVCVGNRGFLVIECKLRSSARIDQETMAGLAFRVDDLRADGAVIVTSVRLQEGAELVRAHKGFHLVYLPGESTLEEFVAKCAGSVLVRPRGVKTVASVGAVKASGTR